jgi:Flp pilus assembly protein TadG
MLIQVGVAIIVLIAFTMFVVDYGIMWVSRSQAQNSADAGALAGAVALAFDDADDLTATGPAQVSARSFALQNDVFGEDPDVQFDTDIRFSITDDDPAIFPSVCLAAGVNCIRVDVYRNQARNNPLPVWFGTLVGLNDQGVRATAMAWSVPGNATECLRPFAVPGLYNENSDPPNDQFDLGVDTVASPGYNLDDHLGTELMLKGGPQTQLGPGWFRLLDIVGGSGEGGGAPDVWSSIRGCTADYYGVGDTLTDQNGNVASIKKAVEDLIGLDPDAEWDDDEDEIVDSCVGDNSCFIYDSEGNRVANPDAKQSPRIIALPVFDIEHYAETLAQNSPEVLVTNILGFFITHVTNQGGHLQIFGRLVTQPGLVRGGNGTVGEQEAFLKVVQLVR